MTEQEKRAKVIAELERVADEANPWKESPPLRCDISYPLLIDALTLLKAREPRVLRVEEVVLLKQNDVVWLEDYDKKDVIPAIVSCMGPMVICIEFALSDRFISVGYDDYGKRWRCWDKEPADEERRSRPWNG